LGVPGVAKGNVDEANTGTGTGSLDAEQGLALQRPGAELPEQKRDNNFKTGMGPSSVFIVSVFIQRVAVV
jgi:hypothetical protein